MRGKEGRARKSPFSRTQTAAPPYTSRSSRAPSGPSRRSFLSHHKLIRSSNAKNVLEAVQLQGMSTDKCVGNSSAKKALVIAAWYPSSNAAPKNAIAISKSALACFQ